MSKQLSSQRYILKINSKKLKASNWDYTYDFDESFKRKDIVKIGDSQTLEFIREIDGKITSEEEINNLKREIKQLKSPYCTMRRKQRKDKLLKANKKLNDLLFMDGYVAIEFATKSDFDRAKSSRGFYLNGEKYKRLVGTTGGIKNNTVIFTKESIVEDLRERLDNGRDKSVPIIPAKLEAYTALSCSASNIVMDDFWNENGTSKILVIKDGTTHIKDKVIRISDDGADDYNVEYNVDYEADKDFTDGGGMISPQEARRWAIKLGLYHLDENGNKVANYTPSGFNTRLAFEKGMVVVFDYKMFGSEIAKTNIVKDVWGKEHDINDIEIILTTNMLKLWNAYDSCDSYLKACVKNNYQLRATKVCPEKLELKRNMNYQYLQSYDFTDDDIKELCSETVNNIKSVLGLDINKAILFSKGVNITEENIIRSDYDFIRALSVDKRILGDSYVKNKLYNMIQKKIKDAKKGVIQVDGSYAIIIGDLYALCQSMFGMEITGLLKKGEFYSRTWSDRGRSKIVTYRSPMTSHNNISVKNLVDNEEVRKWYKYITTMTVFNAWDTTTDRMNGADFDSDAEIEVSNPVIDRTTRNELPIICEQKSTSKVVVTEKLLAQSNKDGFGNAVGELTNRVTTIFELLPLFPVGTPERAELERRILCGQALQQEEIDKIKGIKAKEMPRTWYDYKATRYKEEDNLSQEEKDRLDFLKRIVVNKKPYFFIYNYDNLYTQYSKHIKLVNYNCMMMFGLSWEELLAKENKTEEEEYTIKNALCKSPVFEYDSTMNRICRHIEEEFKDTQTRCSKDDEEFDFSIYKTNKKYAKKTFEEIKEIYKEYKLLAKENSKKSIRNVIDEDERDDSLNIFSDKAYEICPDSEELCNLLIDMCYKSKGSRYFVWKICGEQIIKNLLSKNDNKYKVPIKDEHGDIEWNGLRFSIKEFEEKSLQ